MDTSLSQRNLDRALTMLGELLAYRQVPPCSLIVCGGAALIAAGLVQRSTRDVDIVAFHDAAGGIAEAEPLPPGLLAAAATVAVELGLDANWLNNGPHSLINEHLPNHGLPAGMLARLTARTYGPHLTVHFIGRLDQIHFKLYAAVDRGGPSYHLADLQALQPTAEELLQAARWAMSHDPTPEFAATVRGMLKAIGHDRIADLLH